MATKPTTSLKAAPLADRVVIRALDDGEQMRGGLYIPDTAKEKPQQGLEMARRRRQAGAFAHASIAGPRCRPNEAP